jgi:hypothetical protein
MIRCHIGGAARPGNGAHVLNVATGQTVDTLETYAVTRNGRPYRTADLNFWGVTFADDQHFYATMSTAGQPGTTRPRSCTPSAAAPRRPTCGPSPPTAPGAPAADPRRGVTGRSLELNGRSAPDSGSHLQTEKSTTQSDARRTSTVYESADDSASGVGHKR